MKKIKLKSLVCALSALVISASALATPAFANSAAPWESGVTANGVTIVNENTVLEVESEKLTFNIRNLPKELKEGEAYDARVTAEYSFYNPTENTITTKMAFPIGETPYYAQEIEIKPIENPIKVDGQPIDYAIRHTYSSHYDFEKEARKIKDDYVQTGFFRLDTPVTEYRFTAHVNDKDEGTIFTAPMTGDGSKTKYLCKNSGSEFNYYLRDGEEFSIYVLGENVDLSNLKWKCERYSVLLNDYISVNGSITCDEKTVSYTLKDYALKNYEAGSGISEVDWYNAYYFNYLNQGAGLVAGGDYTPVVGGFTSWYLYETVVEPGGRFTNSVTAQLFPYIYFKYSPNVYGFTYYLSPASGWASFKNLTVDINCDFYLNPNALGGSYQSVEFKKVDGGYTAFFETLPEGELKFGLCSVENPQYNSMDGFPWVLLAILLGIFVILPMIAGAIVLIVVLTRRKKRKNNTNSDSVVTESLSKEKEQRIMYCRNCGKQIGEGVSYCPYCGTPTFNAPPAQPTQPTQPEQPVQLELPIQPIQPVQPTPPAPQANVPPTNQCPQSTNGYAIAGFVLAIISFAVGMFLSILSTLGLVFSILGLVNVKRYNSGKGLAIAGIIISSIIIALLLFIVIMFFISWALAV